MDHKIGTNKAFTLIELVVAIAILVIVISFAGVIFKVSISSQRTAAANAEIMQKLRAITDQLNIDFKGFRKDGYLVLYSDLLNRKEYANSTTSADFRADRLFYFSTGDSQSWFATNVRSNIAKVYFGHDYRSLNVAALPVSEWSLARDIKLMTPGSPQLVDSNDVSFAAFKANVVGTENEAQNLLTYGIPIDVQANPDDVRGLMCQNVGEIKIEWTNGLKAPGDIMLWFGLLLPSGFPVEVPGPPYIATWNPMTAEQYWPKALKFTFTLYDSKGILKQGRTFTHIVYFGD